MTTCSFVLICNQYSVKPHLIGGLIVDKAGIPQPVMQVAKARRWQSQQAGVPDLFGQGCPRDITGPNKLGIPSELLPIESRLMWSS
jgi:hypothetical protein